MGDKLIFYLIGEKVGDEKKDSAIGGILEIISKPYEDDKPVFPSQITKDERYPYRVKVKPLLIPKEEVPFRPLIERLEFITNKKKWSGHLVGKAMREISERDYGVMRGWVEKGM
ncbi:MAG: EVE domain-containing protein [Candidatus Syntropharchaeia archaeon]